MELKVGDILNHLRYGLVVLVKKASNEENNPSNLSFKIHGKKMFTMTQLVSESCRNISLYEKDLNRLKPATDEDIEQSLLATICSFSLSPNVRMSFYPNEEAISLSEKDGESFLYLTKSEIKELKNKLEEILI